MIIPGITYPAIITVTPAIILLFRLCDSFSSVMMRILVSAINPLRLWFVELDVIDMA